MTSPYQVSVDGFEGPFDLLLQLASRRKVDICEVEISVITDDYLAALRAMEQVDLEVTTDFLVVGATLVELKAARLLPDTHDPELEESAVDARDLLYARLLDYRTFKRAAAVLRRRLDAHAGHLPRAVALEPRFADASPPLRLPVDVHGLARLAATALAARPEPTVDVNHLQPVRMSVREAAELVTDELDRAGGEATFAEVTAGCRHRVETIACFLAILELYKHGRIGLEQATCFGELVVSRVERGDAWGADALAALDGDVTE